MMRINSVLKLRILLESVLKRREMPWRSRRRLVKALWQKLTDPENYVYLKAWAEFERDEGAPSAITMRALNHARRRAGHNGFKAS